MHAVEIEAAIVDHRIDIRSDRLPANAKRAKVIVLYEDTPDEKAPTDILAPARAAQAAFPRQAADALTRDLTEMREEWDRQP
jgi:hypothetical protein